MSNVLDFLKKAVPWIAAAGTGNVPALVTMAAKAVSDTLGVPVEATPTAIANAVAAADPAQVIELRKVDADLAVKLGELGYKTATELYATEVSDRTSARDREVKRGDNTNRVLAICIVLAWVGIQAFLLTHVIDPSMRELIARVLGTLDAALTMVLAYYFGSSRGSDSKTQVIADAVAK